MPIELQLLFLLIVILLVSKLSGHLCWRYLHQPVVLGEILAGLLLGPTALNIFGWPIFNHSGPSLHELITMLASIGVLLLMFIAGLETDLEKMRRVGGTALSTAILGVVAPLGLGIIVARLFGFALSEALFIGVVLTATSVSISAQTLMEIRQLGSKEGLTIMGAAVIDDILGIIVLSLVIAFAAASGSEASPEGGNISTMLSDLISRSLGLHDGAVWVSAGITILLMTGFFVVAIILGTRAVPRIVRVAEDLHASHPISTSALVLVFLFALGAEYLGQVAAITGAYLAGLFLARTEYRQRIEQGIHPFTYAFFVPIFFTSIGLNANARELGGGSWVFVLAIIAVAILSKIFGCGLGARVTGFSTPESLRVGIGMISRGEVGLIIAQVGLSAGLLVQRDYAAMVLMVLATTVVTPILLRFSFPPVVVEEEIEVYESVIRIEGDEQTERI